MPTSWYDFATNIDRPENIAILKEAARGANEDQRKMLYSTCICGKIEKEMNMNKNFILGVWEQATSELTGQFIDKFFGKNATWYWVADQIGGVLSVNDYFFNLWDLVEFERYKVTKKQMFDYCEHKEDCMLKAERPMNIHSYLKLWKKKRS